MSFNKITKNGRAVSFSLLISLFNLLFPQHAAAHTINGLASQITIDAVSSRDHTNVGIKMDGVSNHDVFLLKNNFSFQKLLPIASDKKPKKVFYLTVTAYSSTIDQCDSDPFTTASGKRVRDGVIAYNHLPFGTRIKLPEIFPEKTFVVEDRLREGTGKYLADIWMPSREEALRWGAKILKIEVF